MPLTQSEASIFLALPDSPWRFVCFGADDITIPGGDLTTVFTVSPDYGSWVPVRVIKGAPGNITTTLRLRLETTRDEWLRIRCGPVMCRINFSSTGERANPLNYSSAIVLTGGEVGDKTVSAPVSLEPTTTVIESTMAFAFVGHVLWGPPAERSLSTLSDVIMVGAEPESCGSLCVPAVSYLSRLYAITSDGTDHYFARSVTGGSDWTTTELDFRPTTVTRIGQRYLVGGTGGASAPAVIAHSTTGATFVEVELATADGASVEAIVRTQDGAVYAVTSDGVIHRSLNGGLAWNAVFSASGALASAATDGRQVFAVGTGGRMVYGTGATFTEESLGSQSFVAVAVNWARRVVATTATSIYLWAPGLPVTEVGAIGSGIDSLAMSDDGVFGVAAGNYLYITEDGGISWYQFGEEPRSRVTATSGPAWLSVNDDTIYVLEPVERIC